MGLHGALVVRSATGQEAYSTASAYDREAILVLSEVDPNLNANPTGFDMRDYAPAYWLINGAGYPNISGPVGGPGGRLLVRYVNAGFDHPSMALLGAHQSIIARDGFELNNSFLAVAEAIPAGQTVDAIIDISTAAAPGSSIPLYNRNGYVHNNGTTGGSMITAITVGALQFSTIGNVSVPGTTSPYDDADIYSWNGSNFARDWNARNGTNYLPGNADIDGMAVVDNDTFYLSFNRNGGVNVSGLGSVQDEDVVLFDNGAWSLFFDGSTACGLGTSNGQAH